MCGIAGVVGSPGGRAPDRAAVEAMTRALSHRGPDGEGVHLAEGPGGIPAALGHRRLSIIDLSGGGQPMGSPDGEVWITYNGEIYNYRELRRDLEREGISFRTQSDTEVLLQLYLHAGAGCLSFLRGMFAFAVWDGRDGSLFIARDRLGKKPFFYYLDNRGLAFASELQGLLVLPDIPRELDREALDHYLTYQYVPHPWTMFRGIRKLPPAHYGIYRNGVLETHRYWDPDPNPDPALTWADAVSETRRLLTESVELRMVADVPVGAFLSGGIDSSLVVALMAQASSRPIRTFSIGFEEAAYNELPYARQVAERCKTEHREEVVRPRAIEILPELIRHYGEPFGDSSSIPTMYLARLAGGCVKVVQSGDGGDEAFLGYPRYRGVKLARWLDGIPGLRGLLSRPLWQKIPAVEEEKAVSRQLKKFCRFMASPAEERYLRWIEIFSPEERRALYRDPARCGPTERFLLDLYARCPGHLFESRTSQVDLGSYVPCDLMTKVDIAAMAASLETRCPFLDHQLIEFALKVPGTFQMRGLRGKRLLREAFEDLLPGPIWDRPKMGFGVPIGGWFRNELKGLLLDLLSPAAVRARGVFEPDLVERLVREHVEGRRHHGPKLWLLVNLELWMRAFL
jgi:asparagine synthase (glutamine-hydrolysing)